MIRSVMICVSLAMSSSAIGGERIRTVTIEGIGMWWDRERMTYVEDNTKEPVEVLRDEAGRLYLKRTDKAFDADPWGHGKPPAIVSLEVQSPIDPDSPPSFKAKINLNPGIDVKPAPIANAARPTTSFVRRGIFGRRRG